MDPEVREADGISQCHECGHTQPFRCGGPYNRYKVGDSIWPGFTGRCVGCNHQGFQKVIEVQEKK